MKKTLMLFAVICGWTICGLSSTALADDEVNPNTVTSAKLSAIRIPEIKFKQTPLSDVIAYLEKESLEQDPGPVVTGVRFIYMPPKDKAMEPTVKLALRNAKLGTALDLICQQTGYEWDYRDGMVVVKADDDVKPAGTGAHMETKVFDINQEMVSRAVLSQPKQ